MLETWAGSPEPRSGCERVGRRFKDDVAGPVGEADGRGESEVRVDLDVPDPDHPVLDRGV